MRNNFIYIPTMRKLFMFFVCSILLFSCAEENKGNKQSQLDALYKEHVKLNEKIKKLEKEIAMESGAKKNQRSTLVKLAEVKPMPFVHYLDIYGKVDAEENVMVGPQMPGTVSKILVKTGQKVSRGQILAALDDGPIVSGIEELKTGLAFARDMFEKQSKLWDQKIGTEIQYLSAKNQKEALEKKLITLQEQLDMTRIKSPIEGTVDEVYLKVGQATAPGAPGIRVLNLKSLKAVAEVAETYASKVKTGNDVTVRFPDLNRDFESKISYSAKNINPLNRTFNVEVALNSDDDFHPNMLAILKIADYKKESALIVPVNVVQNSENGQYVMLGVMKDGKWQSEKRAVKVGQSYGDHTEILEGLSSGDKVIVTGFQDLNTGDLIKP
jgi:membrane fusion protein (multidrug efflux system)